MNVALARLAGLVLTAALLAACGGGGGTASTASTPAAGSAGGPATPATLTKVTIGTVNVLPWAPIFVATEKGYFREQGIDAELVPFQGGADILTQTAAGQLNVGTGGSSGLFNIVGRARQLNQGQPVRVVAPLHLERPPLATPIVVSKKAYDEGRITKLTDLRGKKVAINAPGTATEFWLGEALKTAGMTVKDVEVVGIPFPNVAQALDSGAIAGAALTEPFATLAKQQGLITVVNDRFLDGEIGTLLFYNSDWAQKNPRLAQGFMTAYLKAVRDLESGGWSDPATLAMLSKYTSVPPETIAATSRPFSDPDGKVSIPALQNQQTFFREQGRLTYDQPLDVAAIVDSSYATEAVKALGPFKPR
jgi:NitT/TauT family transport system substrate-binding protein